MTFGIFEDIVEIVPFMRKAIQKIPYTEEEKQRMVLNLHRGRSAIPSGSVLKGSRRGGKTIQGKLIPDSSKLIHDPNGSGGV